MIGRQSERDSLYENKNSQNPVRVRIAPSPTGYAHIGLARTALFNYLFAKKNNGIFVLRIEDTDKERSKKEYEDDIISDFKWLGIQWNEGPDIGGSCGPYRQSERVHIYREYLEKLAAQNRIYKCYCTKEELEQERQEQELAKLPPHYSGKCRLLSVQQQNTLESKGREHTLRFRLEPGKVTINDMIRGPVTFDTSLMDDFIIAKDFDTPLYNFAVIIDDFLMAISHVIRGEEHISNTPKQIQLSEALHLPIPVFGHLPLILDTDRKKMSKRENKTILHDYRNEGYLPEALLNFIVLLGWNPGGDQELFTLHELEEEFDIGHVNKSGSIFDVQKLNWFNGYYIRHSDVAHITNLAIPYFIDAGYIKSGNEDFRASDGRILAHTDIERIVSIERTRMRKLSEITINTSFYFHDPLNYSPELLQWKQASPGQIVGNLTFSLNCFQDISNASWNPTSIESCFKKVITDAGMSNGEILWPLRIALSGLKASPSPFEIAWVLGREITMRRINYARSLLAPE